MLHGLRQTIILATLTLVLCSAAWAAPPEISFVLEGPLQFWMRPDAGQRPSILTGENLDAPGLVVWAWAPPSKDTDIAKSAPTPDWTPPALPAKPPAAAVRLTVLDAERQTLVVDLTRQPLSVLWVQTQEGLSAPYLFGTAASGGCWLMDEALPPGGQTFGFNLGANLRLVGAAGAITPKLVPGPTSLVYFQVPPDTPPGDYQLYTHNGRGGAFGWRRAAGLQVIPPPPPVQVFQADDFGAKGDGRTNDFDALAAAMKAAGAAGGGEVFLPPGTYLVNKTLALPVGVTLRGASRQNTVLKAFGPLDWTVQLGDNSGIRDLAVTESEVLPTFRGLVGGGGVGLTISDCELVPLSNYAVLMASPQARRLRITNNVIHGSLRLFWHGVTRAEVVGNTILGGGFGGRPVSESVFAHNVVRDGPSRNAFDSTCRSLYEANELHGFWYGPFPADNWEEAMMSHGGGDKVIGSPTASDASSLTDNSQTWKPGEHRGQWVLLTAGRGFGQYRRVVDNTKDTLTLEEPWRVQPDPTTRYALGDYYVENLHRNNLVEGWGVFVLWQDQINNRVEGLTTAAAGAVLTGRDRSSVGPDGKAVSPNSYNPSWYNVISNCSIEGGSIDLEVETAGTPANTGPVLFANLVCNNRITAPELRRMGLVRGMETQTHYTGPGTLLSSHAGVTLKDLKLLGSPGTSRRGTHTIIGGNYFIDAPFAVALEDVAGKTFLLNNQYEFVQTPLLAGAETLKQVYTAGDVTYTNEGGALVRRELPAQIWGAPAPTAPTPPPAH